MMKKIAILIFFVINSAFLFSQIPLTIEGTVTNSSETGVWNGINIQRDVPTSLIFRNNSITSVNTSGYLLLAGDEEPIATSNHLDGAIITGNRFTWNGTPGVPITHGLQLGYNINDVVRWNYLDKLPYGVVYKSGTDAGTNMTNTSGSFAYNIVRNSTIGVRIKGMNGVSVYNNTFYDDLSANNAFIWISSNDGRTIPAVSTGTKIKNNIFYATHNNIMIYVDSPGNLSGFECDYNVYYTTTGIMNFYNGTSWKSFAQWQALGYDTHSVVVNPNFTNTTDLVPASRLNYGTNLGTTLLSGLSTTAVWTLVTSPFTADQNGTWQVGARVYAGDGVVASPVYVSSVVENATPSLIEMTYSITLANIIPVTSSFSVRVNSAVRAVNSVVISGTKVQLTLASAVKYGDIVTVSYTKPATNPLQSSTGGIAISISAQSTINNLINSTKDIIPVTVTMTISPYHVHKVLNVVLSYSGTPTTTISPEIIRISDLSGHLFIEKLLVTGVTSIRIPLNLSSGIYNVILSGGGVVMATQRMMVY